jgi:hypothetical protein
MLFSGGVSGNSTQLKRYRLMEQQKTSIENEENKKSKSKK